MKLYFSPLDDGKCYQLSDIINDAKDTGLDEIEITEAKRITDWPYFFCQEYDEPGQVGTCGRHCPKYSPCNGKNGRCRYSGYCYEPTDKKRIIKLK